jgi:hypothetical protein
MSLDQICMGTLDPTGFLMDPEPATDTLRQHYRHCLLNRRRSTELYSSSALMPPLVTGFTFSLTIFPPFLGGVSAFMMFGSFCPCAPSPLHLMPPIACPRIQVKSRGTAAYPPSRPLFSRHTPWLQPTGHEMAANHVWQRDAIFWNKSLRKFLGAYVAIVCQVELGHLDTLLCRKR